MARRINFFHPVFHLQDEGGRPRAMADLRSRRQRILRHHLLRPRAIAPYSRRGRATRCPGRQLSSLQTSDLLRTLKVSGISQQLAYLWHGFFCRVGGIVCECEIAFTCYLASYHCNIYCEATIVLRVTVSVGMKLSIFPFNLAQGA